MKLTRVAAAIVLALALVATGCGSSSKKKSSSSSGTSTQQIKAPKIGVSITKPKPGQKLGSTVTAKVTLKNFVIDVKDVGKAPIAGKGHLHFSMDGGKYDYPKYSGANGQLGKKLGVNGKYSPSLTKTITYKHLPKGKHKLVVFLANNDHSNAGAQAKVSFKVK